MLKYILFAAICLYASVIDLRTHTVPKHMDVLLFLVGLIQFHPSALWGFALVFFPLFLLGWLSDGYGYGDVIFCGMCSFVLQGVCGALGVVAACIIGLAAIPLCRVIRKQPIRAPIPLVPVFSAGFLLIGSIILL